MHARVVALTGGIGSGKSTVGRMLASRGLVVVDADQIARDLVAPGSPGHDQVVAAFGPEVVGPGGSLDRTKLASQVFADPEARTRLEAIVHPLVEQESQRQFRAAPPDSLVFYEVPLLAETDRRADFDSVVVVDAPDEVRLARLVARGMAPSDARNRMAAQATRAERLSIADQVINNSGSELELAAEVEQLLDRLGVVSGSG
jgi:dephospho-CoA kinase